MAETRKRAASRTVEEQIAELEEKVKRTQKILETQTKKLTELQNRRKKNEDAEILKLVKKNKLSLDELKALVEKK